MPRAGQEPSGTSEVTARHPSAEASNRPRHAPSPALVSQPNEPVHHLTQPSDEDTPTGEKMEAGKVCYSPGDTVPEGTAFSSKAEVLLYYTVTPKKLPHMDQATC